MSKSLEATKKRQALMEALKTELAETDMSIGGITRCTDRLAKLINLDAPLAIISREVEMIQYRALDILSLYEAYLLAKWAMSENPDENTE